MANLKRIATWLSVAVGVFTALMVLYFSYALWFDHSFTHQFAPPLDVIDYGSFIRDRWIANRILPYGVVMIVAAVLKEYRVIGYLLLMRFGVDIFDGFVITLAYVNDAASPAMLRTMAGAYFLSLLNLAAGTHLVRRGSRSGQSSRTAAPA
jgi:hypothetical protein